jgi:hypothetical protein
LSGVREILGLAELQKFVAAWPQLSPEMLELPDTGRRRPLDRGVLLIT